MYTVDSTFWALDVADFFASRSVPDLDFSTEDKRLIAYRELGQTDDPTAIPDAHPLAVRRDEAHAVAHEKLYESCENGMLACLGAS